MNQRRNTLRHANHSYTQPGAYFITICAHKGIPVFGCIVDERMELNPLGRIAHRAWLDLPNRHTHIKVDPFVIMPNHVHALIWIQAEITEGSTAREYGNPVAGSISMLVTAYKGAVTKKANNANEMPGPSLWQRNFYDRIVRSERELANVQEYIRTNPVRWQKDQLHPDAPPNSFNQW